MNYSIVTLSRSEGSISTGREMLALGVTLSRSEGSAATGLEMLPLFVTLSRSEGSIAPTADSSALAYCSTRQMKNETAQITYSS